MRIVKANNLDLTQFQFDYELTFAVVFMNADRTVYGRYGSRSSRENAESDVSVAGLADSMKAVLKLHSDYPGNRRLLTGKQPKPSSYQTPLDIPSIRGKYRSNLDYEGKVVESCVHCHQVTEALRQSARLSPDPMPAQLIFPYPSPWTVGFSLDPSKRATVSKVRSDSPAGLMLKTGDELVAMGRQAIVSQADVQWILHHAKAEDMLPMQIRRDGELISTTLRLPDRWRFNSDVGWRTAGWEMRRMALGGLKLISATDAQRRAAGANENDLALVVDYVGQYVEFGTAKRVGFKKGDIIVKYGPLSGHMTESQLLAWSVLNTRPGQKVGVTVDRAGQRITLKMPMQK